VLSFLIGFLNIGIYNGAWINICEYTHGKWKHRLSLLLLLADTCTVILSALYFKYISNNCLYFLIFGVTVNVFGLLGTYFLPESPEYLYSFYRFSACREVFNKISIWNKKENRIENYEFDVEMDLKNIMFK
jgi:predicted ABC-type sugar transport system permease subunit